MVSAQQQTNLRWVLFSRDQTPSQVMQRNRCVRHTSDLSSLDLTCQRDAPPFQRDAPPRSAKPSTPPFFADVRFRDRLFIRHPMSAEITPGSFLRLGMKGTMSAMPQMSNGNISQRDSMTTRLASNSKTQTKNVDPRNKAEQTCKTRLVEIELFRDTTDAINNDAISPPSWLFVEASCTLEDFMTDHRTSLTQRCGVVYAVRDIIDCSPACESESV